MDKLQQNHTYLYEDSEITIYKGNVLSDSSQFIIKTFASHSKNNTDKLIKESELLSSCSSPFIAKVHAVNETDNGTELILEDFDGAILSGLQHYFENDINNFIDIAIEMAKAIQAVHEAGLTLRKLTVDSFLYDRNKNNILLIDLMEASRLPTQWQQFIYNQHNGQALHFISPEMTGRMNRHVDYRSDYYSLGVVFHQLLTGNPPFVFEDPLELVYAHLAVKPQALNEVNELVPHALSRIVLKLLEKNAENRYQSADGLIYDLQQCQKLLDTPDVNEDYFVPGERDFSETIHIPQKLYGREEEVQQLIQGFDAAAKGRKNFFLVSGYSGVGKTSLVHEMHKPITEKKAFSLKVNLINSEKTYLIMDGFKLWIHWSKIFSQCLTILLLIGVRVF